MVEIDFWMRPKASEVLELVDSLSEESTQVYMTKGEVPDSIVRNVSISAGSDKWEKVSWLEYWYDPTSSELIV